MANVAVFQTARVEHKQGRSVRVTHICIKDGAAVQVQQSAGGHGNGTLGQRSWGVWASDLTHYLIVNNMAGLMLLLETRLQQRSAVASSQPPATLVVDETNNIRAAGGWWRQGV